MWDTPQNRSWLSGWLVDWIEAGASMDCDLYEDGYIWLCRFTSPDEWPDITTDDDAARMALAQLVLGRVS